LFRSQNTKPGELATCENTALEFTRSFELFRPRLSKLLTWWRRIRRHLDRPRTRGHRRKLWIFAA